jgi:hypothetical protein
MDNTANRFIAFIDILGFKDFVGRNTHNIVLEKLTHLSDSIAHIKKTTESDEVKKSYGDTELTPYIFLIQLRYLQIMIVFLRLNYCFTHANICL